jgi:lipopolysaccharide heptosyltransferase III
MNILFITNTRIGDAILTTGCLEYLLKKYPFASFTIAAGQLATPLFEDFPQLKRIISINKMSYSRHWFYLWKECLFTQWDIIVDYRNSVVSRALFCKNKYYKRKKQFKKFHKLLYNAKLLGLNYPLDLKIWLNESRKKQASEILKKVHGSPIIIFAPMANWQPKTWPMKNFIQLASKLQKLLQFKNATFLVTGAPHEKKYCAPLINSLPKDSVIALFEGVHLLTVAACFKQASLFIGNDSGLMHMACACKIPTLGLFGPTNVNLYKPLGEKTAVVCSGQTEKNDNKDMMHAITVDMVLSKIKKLMGL